MYIRSTYSFIMRRAENAGVTVWMAWRTTSAEALQAAAEKIEAAGITGEWFEGNGIGRAYRFVGPFGHPMTLHWDVTRHHDTEGEAASIYPDRPSRRSKVAGAPRQLDHVTIATSDVDAFVKRCGAPVQDCYPARLGERRPVTGQRASTIEDRHVRSVIDRHLELASAV